MIPIAVKRIGNHNLPLPERKSADAAGLDLRANITGTAEWGKAEFIDVNPHKPAVIGCGFGFEIPRTWFGQIAPRSGLATKGIATTPGVIDADYRGEVKAILVNHTNETVRIHHGDRIVQLLILPIGIVTPVEVEELTPTERGEKGLGSTGVR